MGVSEVLLCPYRCLEYKMEILYSNFEFYIRISVPFDIANATKQGCVLAPLLFCIFFSIMLLVAFKDCDAGIPIRFRTDGSLFNLRRLQARSKTFAAVVRNLLYADDSALMALTQADA